MILSAVLHIEPELHPPTCWENSLGITKLDTYRSGTAPVRLVESNYLGLGVDNIVFLAV